MVQNSSNFDKDASICAARTSSSPSIGVLILATSVVARRCALAGSSLRESLESLRKHVSCQQLNR